MAGKRGRASVLLPAVLGLAIAATGGGAFRFFSTMSVHPDPDAVPSTAGAHAESHPDAI
jgi:hypothetical protein